jgi:hypothetical protein
MLLWWPVPLLLETLHYRDPDQLQRGWEFRLWKLAPGEVWAREVHGENLVW